MSYNTGDVLIYHTKYWYSRLLELIIRKKYSHVGIILKNPKEWLDPNLQYDDEYYVLESGAESWADATSGKHIFGVQISPLSKILEQYKKGAGNLYVRPLQAEITHEQLHTKIKNAYIKVKEKSYDVDVFDWVRALYDLKKDIYHNSYLTNRYQLTSRFWCSALVSYIFVECELLDKDVPWTLISPNDFVDIHYRKTDFPLKNCTLGDMYQIV